MCLIIIFPKSVAKPESLRDKLRRFFARMEDNSLDSCHAVQDAESSKSYAAGEGEGPKARWESGTESKGIKPNHTDSEKSEEAEYVQAARGGKVSK